MGSTAMSTAHKLSPDAELRAEARASMEYAVQNLARLQNASGSWPGDYGGPSTRSRYGLRKVPDGSSLPRQSRNVCHSGYRSASVCDDW